MKKIFTSVLLIIFICTTTSATQYTVNSTSDASTGAGTSGTLRWCIAQANVASGKDTINFSVSGTFTVGSNYPVISYPLYINGYSSSGTTQGQLGTSTRVLNVVLNGPGNNTVFGLQITAS